MSDELRFTTKLATLSVVSVGIGHIMAGPEAVGPVLFAFALGSLFVANEIGFEP